MFLIGYVFALLFDLAILIPGSVTDHAAARAIFTNRHQLAGLVVIFFTVPVIRSNCHCSVDAMTIGIISNAGAVQFPVVVIFFQL